MMACEPMVLWFKTNEKGEDELIGVHGADSPRHRVIEAIKEVAEKSEWMFREDQPRLRFVQNDRVIS